MSDEYPDYLLRPMDTLFRLTHDATMRQRRELLDQAEAGVDPKDYVLHIEASDAVPDGEAWLVGKGAEGKPEIKAKIVNIGEGGGQSESLLRENR